MQLKLLRNCCLLTTLPSGPERVGVSGENTPAPSLGGSPDSWQSSLTSLETNERKENL